MKHSESTENIFSAYVKTQSELKPIHKTAIGVHNSKYAPLEEIIKETNPILTKNGLAILQDISFDNVNNPIISTMLVHTSGEWIKQDGLKVVNEKNNAHGVGSAVSYAKRYALCAMLNIAADEDDDGNASIDTSKKKPVNKPTSSLDKYNTICERLQKITDNKKLDVAIEYIEKDNNLTENQRQGLYDMAEKIRFNIEHNDLPL